MVVRPLRRDDVEQWREVRERNADWLRPWDATPPPQMPAAPVSYAALARRLRRQGRAGQTLPVVIGGAGAFAGQATVNNIVRGSAPVASVGYWLDQRVAGRGVAPLAVAMVIDHCLGEGLLHRIEVCVRPENTNSLRVVEKLGIREVGFAPFFLHIDGAWRDHRVFAITVEELGAGLVARLAP